MAEINTSKFKPEKKNMNRRQFIQVGGLTLALPALGRAEPTRSHKGTIIIFLAGGPPHLDMFDMKPQAPVEVRGEFNPINTNVPGMEICELMPQMATMMDKFAVIKSLTGCVNRHESHMCFSGYPSPDEHPCMGSFVSKLQGYKSKEVPPFVGLSPKTKHKPWGNPGESGFLGTRHAAATPNDGGIQDMILKESIDTRRLNNRKNLLKQIDGIKKDVGLSSYRQQAFDILTSNKFVDALDIEKVDPKLREFYGKGSDKMMFDGPWRLLDQFLIARQLIEAGVRVVTLAFSRWDWHGNIFNRARQDIPMLDQGLSALVTDIHNRGLDKDISVLCWGEFGRTPKINESGGRDHHPRANFAVLAGGNMQTGQSIGTTDKLANEPKDRPIHVREVLSTLYYNMGVDLNTAVKDNSNRPHYILDYRKPIEELV